MFPRYLGFCGWKHDSPQRPYPMVIEELCHQFSLANLRKSTNNFAENQIIGSGGLGTVYKGCLQNNDATDSTVAIKRICASTDKEFREFKKEIELLCQLRHPNLVNLIGFCNHKDEKIVVYGYCANESLYNHLYKKIEPLTWKQRLKICIGAACGLHYLHTGAKRTIFHGDIHPHRILLDSNMVPKLADFRFSLQGPAFTSKPKPKSISNDNFIGTHGYMAPEILQNKTVTDKCDVYSFGIVLLEVVCKDKLGNVKSQRYPVEENIDPNLKGNIAPECWEVFVDVTERCLKFDPNERPIIGEVELQLELALSHSSISLMANEVNDLTVKVIEQCQVSPPPGSVPSTTLPLSYLDLHWFYCTQVKRIFFYKFPHPKHHHFLQTTLPILKNSLSFTLQQFFPFAANLVYPPKPHIPYILYSEGDSISFTIAESTENFTHLISNSPRNVKDTYPFVPMIPSPRLQENGTLLIPTMAIQVTVFANSGFTICVTFNHVISDGRSFHHFMKFWASVSKNEASIPLPLHNRNIIEDTKMLAPSLLEELWDSYSPFKIIESTPSDMVRHRFTLSHHQVEKLKKWVANRSQNFGLDILHMSTFVVTCSLFWVCKVKTELQDIIVDPVFDNNNDQDCYGLAFLVDLRNRSDFSIPSTYLGNCLALCHATLPKRKLVGENGICEAVNAIGREIRGLSSDPLKGVEELILGRRKRLLGKSSQRMIIVAGSPKLNVYETDFGWGKPVMGEVLHADDSSTMCFSDSMDKDCDIEVGLVLEGDQMKKLCAILDKQLTEIVLQE